MAVSKNIRLERVLQDLLNEQDCVIIPGFGGFVSHYQSAVVEAAKKIILPPSKQLSFNIQLKKNDGLLAYAVSDKCGISYNDALDSIAFRVDFWKKQLEESKYLELENVGSFLLKNEGNLVFEQFNEANYDSASYGLPLLHATPIEREGIVKKLEREIKKSSPSSTKIRKTLTRAAAIAILLTSTTIGLYNFGGDKVQETWASLDLLSAFSSDNNKEETIEVVSYEEFFDEDEQKLFKDVGHTGEENLETINQLRAQKSDVDVVVTMGETTEEIPAVDDLAESKALIKSDVSSEVNKAETISVDEEVGLTAQKDIVKPISETNNSDFQFQVVAGCFREEKNASKLVKKLNALGYNALITGKTKNGLHRVCYGASNSEVDALKLMAKAKLNHNPQAWLFRN